MVTINKERYPLLLIQWKDAESDPAWASQDDMKKWIKEDCVCNEIGWVVGENKKYYIISNQILCDGTIGNRTKIPKNWVKKIKKISV